MADIEQAAKRNFLSQHSAITVSLADEIHRIRASDKWMNGDRHVESLVKGEGINVALVMLKKGARLDEHRTKAPFAVHVIEGQIALLAQGLRHELAPGLVFALEREIPHAVEAISDAAFVLTIGGE